MSQASELLNSVTESAAGTATEGNIVIGRDRYIVVPDSLKKIGVQYDHDVETVTFDCPRYWDNWDLSTMRIYINYMRADGGLGMHWCQNVTVDASNSELVHFDWTISGHVTEVAGQLSFLVCIKNVEIDGIEKTHWNSELNTEMYISAGLKCKETILRKYPDIISQLLLRMETAETNLQTWIKETEKEIADWEANLKKDINTWETNTYNKMDDRMKTAEGNTTPAEILRRINNALDTNAETQQQIYDAAADYLRDGIVATGKIEEETNAYLEENLAIIADDLLDITLEKTIEKSGVVIPSGEGNMLPVKIMGDSYQKQLSGKNLLDFGNYQQVNGAQVSFDNGVLTVVGDGTKTYQSAQWDVTDLCKGIIGKEISLSCDKFECLSYDFGVVAQLTITKSDGTKQYLTLYNAKGQTATSQIIPTDINKALINIYANNTSEDKSGANTTTVTKPMLYFGTVDEKPEYEPYCGGVPSPNPEFPQEIENVGVVRNLLKPYHFTSSTNNGITFTEKYDENGLLEYIECNGTATADAYRGLSASQENPYDNSYILNGCPSGGSSTTYMLKFQLLDNANTWKASADDYGSGATLSDEYPNYRIEICIKSGQTCNKLRFYPMIRPAHITDPTYHPYIPENKENLIPYPYVNSTKTENGVTFTDNGDGSIKMVGTVTTGYATFMLNYDWQPVPGIYKKNVGVNCYFKIARYKRSSNSYDAVVVENNITVFDTSDWDFETYRYQPAVQIHSSLGAVDDMFHPRIVKNHIPAQGSQYAVEVKSVGKNVFNHSLVPEIVNGVTITVDETIKASGTTTREITKYLFKNTTNPIVADKNGLFIKGAKTLIGMYYKAKIVKEDGLINYVDMGRYGYYVKPNSKIEEIYLQINSTGTYVSVEIEPQIVEGNIDLPYSPYQSHSTTIHLDEPLRGIGEYRDTICQKDGVWGVERVVGEEVFDGSDDEGWRYDESNTSDKKRCCTQKLSSIIQRATINSAILDMFCTTYIAVSANKTYTLNEGISVDIGGWLLVYDENFNTSDISLWKTHLSENPITVEYPLATPTFTPFEDQTPFWKMMAFDGATTISIIDGSDNTVPVGVFRVGRNQDGGKLLSHHSTLNNMEDLEGKITPIPILLEDYNKLPESKKNSGIYVITDAHVTDFTGNAVLYTGTREGLGNTVDDAISTVDEKIELVDEKIELVDEKVDNVVEIVKNMVTYQWDDATQTLNIVVSQG